MTILTIANSDHASVSTAALIAGIASSAPLDATHTQPDGFASARLASFAERVRSGEIRVPANPKHPTRVFWKGVAEITGIPVGSLRAEHLSYRAAVQKLADDHGLAQVEWVPFADYTFRTFADAFVGHLALQDSGAVHVERVADGLAAIAASPHASLAVPDCLRAVMFDGTMLDVNADLDISAVAAQALTCFENWRANRDLPASGSDMLTFAVARTGRSANSIASEAGVTQPTLCNWMHKTKPTRMLLPVLDAVGAVVGLPENALREAFKGHLPPDRRARMFGSSQYGKATQWRQKFPYVLKEWPERLQSEFDGWKEFRTAPLAPFGMERPRKLLKRKTVLMAKTYLSMVFGTWTTDLNSRFCMDPGHLSCAYLVFPQLIHARLEFILERSRLANGTETQFLTAWEVDQLRFLRSLFDAGTGWLSQMPELADRLAPVYGRDGKVIVSPAEVERVKSDWTAACARAREQYVALKKNHVKFVQRGRDPHADVLAILEMSNPLDAFAMLCGGLQDEIAKAGEEHHFNGASSRRDAVLAGILCQTALRLGTISALNLRHLVWDIRTSSWHLRIERQLFKNPEGPYFGHEAHNNVRPYYERRLMDKFGLYDAIRDYLGWARAYLLKGVQTEALFASGQLPRRSTTETQCDAEPGRAADNWLRKTIHRLTGTHVGYNAETGRGIKGIVSFPCHAFRHILATGILKTSRHPNPRQQAADAIHDSIRTVEAYLRYLPKDREADLMETLEEALSEELTAHAGQRAAA